MSTLKNCISGQIKLQKTRVGPKTTTRTNVKDHAQSSRSKRHQTGSFKNASMCISRINEMPFLACFTISSHKKETFLSVPRYHS